MDKLKNTEQNNSEIRNLRDNFRNIQDFREDSNQDAEESWNQEIENRNLRDNFKNIQEFMNAQHYRRP